MWIEAEPAEGEFEGFRCVFIRAPQLRRPGSDVEVLARVDGWPVFIRQGNIWATTFHPELGEDPAKAESAELAVRNKPDSVLAEYEKALADGSAQAQGILRQSADDMAAEAAKRQATLGDKLAEEVKAAEARIVDAKEAAVGNISQVATEVAQAAARRLIDLDVGAPAAEASVKAVLEAKG